MGIVRSHAYADVNMHRKKKKKVVNKVSVHAECFLRWSQ